MKSRKITISREMTLCADRRERGPCLVVICLIQKRIGRMCHVESLGRSAVFVQVQQLVDLSLGFGPQQPKGTIKFAQNFIKKR